jgi:hypothetical protein
MLIVKEPTGSIRQYDFGPGSGRDVSFRCPLMQQPERQDPPTNADEERVEWRHSAEEGEVRETLLSDLPTHLPLLLVGRARDNIDVAAIRQFSLTQPLRYQLCERDCRHYTNDLYQFICGESENAMVTSRFIKAQFDSKIERYRAPLVKHLLHRPLISLIQSITAQENWDRTKARLETFKTSFTGAVCGIGLHLAVQPPYSAPMTAMAVAGVAASASSLLASSVSKDRVEAQQVQQGKRKNEGQGQGGKGFLGAAQAIGFGALTVASAALTASMGTRALYLPANAAMEVGRRVSRIASSPQALSTLHTLRRAVQQKKEGMRRVASAGVLMLPSSQVNVFETSRSSCREGRSKEGGVRFKARGGSPEGRALLFTPSSGRKTSSELQCGLLSPPVLSFTSSEYSGKKRRQGEWTMNHAMNMSSSHHASHNYSEVSSIPGLLFKSEQRKMKGISACGTIMSVAPERSILSTLTSAPGTR